tara:strand:- start:881 stop:1318 length:438 start_codon:yes stop_codon:yes gene_type:complete
MLFIPNGKDPFRSTPQNLNVGWHELIIGEFEVIPGIGYKINLAGLLSHLYYAFKLKPIGSATWGELPIGDMLYCVNRNCSYMYIYGTDDNFYSNGGDIVFDEIKLFFPEEIQEIDINIPPTITDFVQQQITAKIDYVNSLMASPE